MRQGGAESKANSAPIITRAVLAIVFMGGMIPDRPHCFNGSDAMLSASEIGRQHSLGSMPDSDLKEAPDGGAGRRGAGAPRPKLFFAGREIRSARLEKPCKFARYFAVFWGSKKIIKY